MTATVLLATAGAVVGLLVATWLVSLVVHDASIVDIVWGLGFTVASWVAWVAAGDGHRTLLLPLLTSVWGLRLAGYLAWRNLGHGEDKRYVAMRRRYGDRFWLVSLGTVFLLQAALLWVVSLPTQLGQTGDGTVAWPVAAAAIALWAVGLAFEAVGDLQLARFKADPTNEGQVMDRGLWRYTRHPNYFGDFCVWWGIWLAAVAVAGTVALIAVVGPLVMSFLLMRVSGVPLLEKGMHKRRPGYADYVARTSGFFPRPPRPAAAPDATADTPSR